MSNVIHLPRRGRLATKAPVVALSPAASAAQFRSMSAAALEEAQELETRAAARRDDARRFAAHALNLENRSPAPRTNERPGSPFHTNGDCDESA